MPDDLTGDDELLWFEGADDWSANLPMGDTYAPVDILWEGGAIDAG